MVEQVLGTLVMAWPRAGRGTQFHSNYSSCRKALTCQPPASSKGRLVGLGPEPPMWLPCAGPEARLAHRPWGPSGRPTGSGGTVPQWRCPPSPALPELAWLPALSEWQWTSPPEPAAGLPALRTQSALEVTESIPSKHGYEPCEGLLTPREQI